jgi:hypothetical protein
MHDRDYFSAISSANLRLDDASFLCKIQKKKEFILPKPLLCHLAFFSD